MWLTTQTITILLAMDALLPAPPRIPSTYLPMGPVSFSTPLRSPYMPRFSSKEVHAAELGRIAEERVRQAWRSDPLVAPFPLQARAVGTRLEVSGIVWNERIKQWALHLAQTRSPIRVVDAIRVGNVAVSRMPATHLHYRPYSPYMPIVEPAKTPYAAPAETKTIKPLPQRAAPPKQVPSRPISRADPDRGPVSRQLAMTSSPSSTPERPHSPVKRFWTWLTGSRSSESNCYSTLKPVSYARSKPNVVGKNEIVAAPQTTPQHKNELRAASSPALLPCCYPATSSDSTNDQPPAIRSKTKYSMISGYSPPSVSASAENSSRHDKNMTVSCHENRHRVNADQASAKAIVSAGTAAPIGAKATDKATRSAATRQQSNQQRAPGWFWRRLRSQFQRPTSAAKSSVSRSATCRADTSRADSDNKALRVGMVAEAIRKPDGRQTVAPTSGSRKNQSEVVSAHYVPDPNEKHPIVPVSRVGKQPNHSGPAIDPEWLRLRILSACGDDVDRVAVYSCTSSTALVGVRLRDPNRAAAVAHTVARIPEIQHLRVHLRIQTPR
ncbi:MAG: hypothetical protein KatS3mg105_3865 [Gemmatales bacterium]|nr:MAG: hypothetical protein KatS3mg105_3865 [Gemmatales bacterium]